MLRDPTFIGTVQDVHGASVTVELSNDTVTGLGFVHGEGYRIGQVGSFVRIPLGFVDRSIWCRIPSRRWSCT